MCSGVTVARGRHANQKPRTGRSPELEHLYPPALFRARRVAPLSFPISPTGALKPRTVAMNLRPSGPMRVDKFQGSGLNRGAKSLGCTCRSKLGSADLCAARPTPDRARALER